MTGRGVREQARNYPSLTHELLKKSSRQVRGIRLLFRCSCTATVKIEIAGPATITSKITKEAAEEFKLKDGDKVEAVIKASEVMVLKE